MLLVLLLLPLLADGFKPMAHMPGVNARLNQMYKNQDGFMDDMTMSEQLQMLRHFATLDPARVKRAATSGDQSFVRSLEHTMNYLFKPVVSRHCFTDLIYFVESLGKFTDAAVAAHHSAEKLDPSDQNCAALNNSRKDMEDNLWTIRLLDSLGKLPSGVLHGNYWFMGDFQQCISIEALREEQNDYIRGKFCMAHFGYARTSKKCPEDYFYDNEICSALSLNIGLCVPDSCKDNDVQKMISAILKQLEIKQLEFLLPEEQRNETNLCFCAKSTCHEDLNIREDPGAVIALCILLIIAALMIFGTAYDHYVYRPSLELARQNTVEGETPVSAAEFFEAQSAFVKSMIAFSVITNGERILSTEKRPGQVHCLHGIRFLSLCWVILGHTYYWIVPTLDNLVGSKPLTSFFLNQIILNATFCVDAFFFLSGFLLAYLWLKDAKRTDGARIRKPLFWVMFYVHRYIRLTPVYALIMLTDVMLYRYIADGPFWNQDGLEPNYCRRSWWTNMLYINNLAVQDELCMSWTWYLANDFQFYAFAPIFLVLLFKWEVVGVIFSVVCILFFGVIKGVITLMHGLPPTSLASTNVDAVEVQERYWNTIYVKPWCRVGVYIVGLLLGWILYKTHNKKVVIPRWAVALAWTATTMLHLGLMFGLWNYSKTGDLPSDFEVFIYAALARPLWACGLAWIVFACVHGYGGFVNSILSWAAWIPLSRLTYCAYLLHAFVTHGTYQSRFQSAHFDTHLRMVYYFFGHVLVAYALALFFNLAFETPVLTLEKLIFKTDKINAAMTRKKEKVVMEPEQAQQLLENRAENGENSGKAKTVET